MDIKSIIRKYSLQNAIKYNGKANSGAVLGKILSENPKLRSDVPSLRKQIDSIIKDINFMSVDEQINELKKTAPELLEEKKEEKKELQELKNAKNLVMRFAPSPSGPLHIGHAYVLSLSHAYCKKYKGKLILRIEDTNPENIYPDAYKLIEDDAKWLTSNGINKMIIQSDRLELYYDYAEKLIDKGHAYVCTCDPDYFRELISKSKACPCRNNSEKENHERFDKMFAEYKPGEAVLRIKTNLDDPNPAMRDWPAMRINDHEHPRTKNKYRVWPLMNLAVAIDDHELNVTHSIRGKDHIDNEKRQKWIFDYLKWKTPEHMYVGRINFLGMDLSTTETRKQIEYGKYSGWDDIRLPFLRALRRRGYQAESFVRYALDIGISQADKTVSKEDFFKMLNAHNKDLIDKDSNRYFFIENPIKIKIENAPKRKVKIDLHPDYPKRGSRDFSTSGEFCIQKSDFDLIKDNYAYRLMDCLNFVKKGNKLAFDSLEYENYKEKGKGIMHWLPISKDLLKVEVLMDSGETKKGLGEPSLKKLKEDDIIQLERFGFVKLDKKSKDKLEFWFLHK